jgi:diguanylate cyclase (GGDEF)-like protein
VKPWWNWRDTILGKTDPAYRNTFLQEDIKRAQIVIAAVAILVLGYLFTDYQALQLTSPIYLLAALRILFSSASIWLYFFLPKRKNVIFTDYSILTWSTALVALSFFSTVSQNSISIENVVFNHLWVLSFYLLIPNRQLFKIIPALAVSLVSLYNLLNYDQMRIQGVTDLNLITNISTLAAMNIIGFISSAQLDSQRYHQYLVQKTLLAGREQLRELAITDSLTGTLNRRGFLEMAQVEFDRSKRYGDPFSFVIIDLDKLKTINDTYGHPAGDLALKKLVELIKQEKRSSDTTGRLAGDEFGLLLPNTKPDQAVEVMSRIKHYLANGALKLPRQRQIQISFSAGVTEVIREDESFDDIYRRADKALFLAKDKGRNKIEKA